jgi:hypothetical protein
MRRNSHCIHLTLLRLSPGFFPWRVCVCVCKQIERCASCAPGDIRVATSHHRETRCTSSSLRPGSCPQPRLLVCSSVLGSVGPDTPPCYAIPRARDVLLKNKFSNSLPIRDRPSTLTGYSIRDQPHTLTLCFCSHSAMKSSSPASFFSTFLFNLLPICDRPSTLTSHELFHL